MFGRFQPAEETASAQRYYLGNRLRMRKKAMLRMFVVSLLALLLFFSLWVSHGDLIQDKSEAEVFHIFGREYHTKKLSSKRQQGAVSEAVQFPKSRLLGVSSTSEGFDLRSASNGVLSFTRRQGRVRQINLSTELPLLPVRSPSSSPERTSVQEGEEFIVICVGDSITFGNGSHNTPRRGSRGTRHEGNYPMELGHLLFSKLKLRRVTTPSDRNVGSIVSTNNTVEEFHTLAGYDSSTMPEAYKKGGRDLFSSLNVGTDKVRETHLSIFNFGVGGRTASHHLRKHSYASTPEYGAARRLLSDALETGPSQQQRVAAGSSSTNNSHECIGEDKSNVHGTVLVYPLPALVGRKYEAGEVQTHTYKRDDNVAEDWRTSKGATDAGTKESLSVQRTVVLIVMLGTNDSKDVVWRSLQEAASKSDKSNQSDARSTTQSATRESFVKHYMRLFEGLLPEIDAAHVKSKINKRSNRTSLSKSGDVVVCGSVRLEIIFVSPIPALPHPKTVSRSTRAQPTIIGGIRGLRIATDIRYGVWEASQIATRLVADRFQNKIEASVHFYDLFPDFFSFVINNEVDLEDGSTGGRTLRNLLRFPHFLNASAVPSSRTLFTSAASEGEGENERLSEKFSSATFVHDDEVTYRKSTGALLGSKRIARALHDGVHPQVVGHVAIASFLCNWLIGSY